jgi:hypothetical protein
MKNCTRKIFFGNSSTAVSIDETKFIKYISLSQIKI